MHNIFHTQHITKWLHLWNRIRHEEVTSIRLFNKSFNLVEVLLNGIYEDSCIHYWSEKVTKIKSAKVQHLKIHSMSCTNYVQSFMRSAQFLAMPLYYGVNE